MFKIKDFHNNFSAAEKCRFLAFGSSNTERYLPGMHWFDCLELAIKEKYGRIHTFINTGVGGHTSRQLLERFENDAAFYKPHIVFITIGGNDSNPERNISSQEFGSNLIELHARLKSLNSKVIFQTYYAPTTATCNPKHLNKFYHYMDIVRETAAKTGSDLIDHLRRWDKLQQKHYEEYLKLMLNAFHVNEAGNKVMGVDIARHFGIDLHETDPDYWQAPLDVQKLMDELDKIYE